MSTMTLLQSDMKRTRNQQTIFYLYPIYRNSTFSFLFLFQLFLFLWRALKPSNMCKSGKSWLRYIIIIIIILFIVTSALYSTSNKSFEADMVDIISLEEKRVNSAYGHTLKQIKRNNLIWSSIFDIKFYLYSTNETACVRKQFSVRRLVKWVFHGAVVYSLASQSKGFESQRAAHVFW